MIKIEPAYGNMLGGTGVVVSVTQLALGEDDEIQCIFDGVKVRGVYVSEQQALCISPLLSRTGRLPFQILVTGSIRFSGESTFISCKCSAFIVVIHTPKVLCHSNYHDSVL